MSSQKALPVTALHVRNILATTALMWGLMVIQSSYAQGASTAASLPAQSAPLPFASPLKAQNNSGAIGTNATASTTPVSTAPTPAVSTSAGSSGSSPSGSGSAGTAAVTPATAVQLIQTAQRNAAIYRAQAEEIKARELLESSKHVAPVISATQSPAAQMPAPLPPARVEKKEEPKPIALAQPAAEKKPRHGPPPALVAIYGRDADLQASLRLTTGVIWDVRVGDDLEDGFQVKSITPKKVVVTIDGESIALVPWIGKTGATEPSSQAPNVSPPTFGEPRPETPRAAPSSTAPSASTLPGMRPAGNVSDSARN